MTASEPYCCTECNHTVDEPHLPAHLGYACPRCGGIMNCSGDPHPKPSKQKQFDWGKL